MSSLAEIQDLVHKKYGIELSAMDPDVSLREHGIDSLTLVEFLFEVEDHYGISIPAKYSEVDTLAGLAAAVDELRAVRAS